MKASKRITKTIFPNIHRRKGLEKLGGMLGIASASSKGIAETENASRKETGDSAKESIRKMSHMEEGHLSRALKIRRDLAAQMQPWPRI